MTKIAICAIALLLVVTTLLTAAPSEELQALSSRIAKEFAGKTPQEWGENSTGVRTRLATGDKVLALTLDACGSPKGKGIDQKLIDFLTQQQIPATLFINARWIDANPELFKQLAANPLFEIANHGMRHKPASINGRSVYGIDGTKNIRELVEEIELNARKIEGISGKRPRYYRSGTAYYDELAVQVANRLGHDVIGFSVLGDAGATLPADKVKAALLSSQPGDIVIAHMNHPEAGTGAGIMAAIPLLKKRGFRFVRLSDYQLQ
ncbi:polysaccharide deacetylase family protein [Trichlorobacter lovleyi]|uniref:polysaccharide deacetylase family protein n=1 Tax=Trichlorobacter lovleyi TaxID=313985 RepID=UPI00223FC769|nr:polysaccharide deacetylase family protein [Trichlorobacter lovleyi]QOX78211.1 polysaccharide deacetylase family protein [Trichlorobacter lovleyi]